MPLDINSNPQYERMCESPGYASDPVLLDAVAIVVRKSALSLQSDTCLLAYPPPITHRCVYTHMCVCVCVVTEREGCGFRGSGLVVQALMLLSATTVVRETASFEGEDRDRNRK